MLMGNQFDIMGQELTLPLLYLVLKYTCLNDLILTDLFIYFTFNLTYN